MNLSMIVAVSQNGVIGRDNALPWHLPEDLKRFKSLTMGHHLIMGRRTFESLGRLLPGRTTVIVSRDPNRTVPGAIRADSIEQALNVVAEDPQPFVIGGAAIFEASLPWVRHVYLTRVLEDVEGDVRLDLSFLNRGWRQVQQDSVLTSTSSQLRFRFELWERSPLPN